MFQYVNSFACASNPKQDSVVIRFRQTVPLIDSDTDENGNLPEETCQIASLIMDTKCAKALVDMLGSILTKLPDSNG